MSNIVIQMNQSDLSKLHKHYERAIVKKPANALFLAKVNQTTITAYKSGKVMFQGQHAETEASKWSTTLPNKTSTNTVNDHAYAPTKSLFHTSHIGTDEAGTGDYFGPITVSAVYVPDNKIEELKQLGITDSKTLTDDNIARLAKKLVKLRIPYTLLTLNNKKYNQLQKKGWNQGKMKAMLHHHAIEKLIAKIGMHAPILIDQFCQPSVYSKYIHTENMQLHENTYFMTKAESHSTSVAAASIIARAKFVKEMDLLSSKLGITVPKGASSRVDETCAYLIKKHGMTILEDVAKVHFANTEKAKKYI